MFEEVCQMERSNKAFAIVTIIGSKGTVPRKTGRMVVSSDGLCFGTIGGGDAERTARDEAMSALRTGRGGILTLPHKKGGEITVYIDVPVIDRRICIIGSGHVAQAIAECFYKLKWALSIIDNHDIDSALFPPSDIIVSDDLTSSLVSCHLDENSAVIITDPEKAIAVLPYILSTDVFYIGILASRKWSHGFNDKRIHSPLGLSIGAESPEEIAVSAVAEVLAAFKSENGRPSSKNGIIIIRGAGDLATGVAVRLFKAGYKIVMLDIEQPTVIRRTVAFAEAFYDGEMIVEGVRGVLVHSPDEAKQALRENVIPLLSDPECSSLSVLRPCVLVDAIIAKRNLGTNRTMAPFTIALGPGFIAGVDVDAVIETKRGHFLGSVLASGAAIPNSGVPGIIAGYGKERVIHSPASGIFREASSIGDIVKAGDVIAYIDDTPVIASIDGKLRGLLHSGLFVPVGFKIADIDPRGLDADHTTISDKARAIGGGVLEAVDGFFSRA